MRTGLVLMIVLGLALTGCGRKSADTPVDGSARTAPPAAEKPLLVRWHFVGGGQFSADTNAAVLRQMLALPATGEYREQTLQRLSRAPFQLLRERVAASTNDFAGLLRPMLDDLLTAESAGEARGNPNETPEVTIVVRLDPSRAALWLTNLATVLQAWTTLPVIPEGTNGWVLKKHHAPNLIRLIRVGDWLVAGWGQDALTQHDAAVRRLQSGGRPLAAATDYWLHISAAWPGMGALLQDLPEGCLPAGQMDLKVTGEGDYLRTRGRLVAAQPFPWKPEVWTVPTNLLREPLVSFTAVRSLTNLLPHCRLPGGLPVTPPDQLFAWAVGQIPFQTYAAWPASNAGQTMARLGPQLVELGQSNLPPRFGRLEFAPATMTLNWSGLPFLTPTLEAVTNAPGEFFFASLFPNPATVSPLPAELLGVLTGRTNLVYYDWEITEERLLQWRNLNQLWRAIRSEESPAAPDLGQRWLGDISAKLGNTITEITLAAPNELAFNRKSHGGLTGLEFVALAEWLDSPRFPRLSPRQNRPLPAAAPATTPP